MKGYKGFNKDMTCRDFQYEIGKEYETNEEIELCKRGFHFCKKIIDVKGYYNIENDEVILCEIEATGEIIEGDDKCVTNRIKIIREISKEEMYILGNEGKENTGLGNTGNRNTGNRNTGNRNTGYSNTGYRNTGYRNTGYSNTGDSNTGDRNTGYSNTGYSNTGDWNKTNRSAGVFCNEEPKMNMFNKETDMTYEEWRNSEAYDILTRVTKSQWIWYDEMTEAEKKKYPSAKTCDGYLKETERKTSSKEWWKSLEIYEKATIIQLPNFDLDIFNDIMEFKVTKKEYKEILKWLKSNKETC